MRRVRKPDPAQIIAVKKLLVYYFKSPAGIGYYQAHNEFPYSVLGINDMMQRSQLF